MPPKKRRTRKVPATKNNSGGRRGGDGVRDSGLQQSGTRTYSDSTNEQANETKATADSNWFQAAWRQAGHIEKDRGEIRLRAQEISARTKTVHGDISENIHGPSQYNEALQRLGLYRGSNSQYVPGHCFFSSCALSSPRYASLSFIEGARAMRQKLSAVYRQNSFHGMLRPWMSEGSCVLWPGHENEIHRCPEVSLSVDADEWHHQFFLDRAQMMETVNVNDTSSSLWVYSMFLDHVALVAGSTRPLCVVSTNNNTGIRNFPLLSVKVCSRRATLRARTFRKRKLNASDVSRAEAVIVGRLKEDLSSALRDTHASLTNWRLAARLLERELETQINKVAVSESIRLLPIGFGENVLFYLIDPTCFSVHLANSISACDITKAKFPIGTIFVEHNGKTALAGHYIPLLIPKSINAVLKTQSSSIMSQGIPTERPSKRKKGVHNFKRNAFNSKWAEKFPWIRIDETTLWCYTCFKYPAFGCKDKLGMRELIIGSVGVRGDVFSTHDQKPAHKAAAEFHEKMLRRENNGLLTGIERHIPVTTGSEIMCRKIVTTYTALKKDIALDAISDLNEMQAVNGLEMGGRSYENHAFWKSTAALTAEYYRQGRIEKIVCSSKRAGFSVILDGSGTLSRLESEATCIRYFDFEIHKVVSEFCSLNEIDYSSSADGKSPDAAAVFATSMIPLKRIFGDSYLDDIKKSIVSGSFDGAAVMMGTNNSVATRYLDLQPKMIITHACAHNLELVWSHATKEVSYVLYIAEILSASFNLISGSLKATHALKEIAKSIEHSIVSLKALHGIRWLRSQQRAIQSLLTDWLALVLYCEEISLARVGIKLSSLSSRCEFIDLPITISVEGAEKKGYVVECVSPPDVDAVDEEFKIRLISSRVRNDEYILTKNEVIVRLANGKQAELKKIVEWDLYISLTQYRLVVTLHFLLDLEAELAQLSLTFQTEDSAPSDMVHGFERTLDKVRLLKDTDGDALSRFKAKFDESAESFESIYLEDYKEGKEMFDLDRVLLIVATEEHMQARFGGFVNHPILKAVIKSLEHRNWPIHDDDALRKHGNDEFLMIAEHFSYLRSMISFDQREALFEWVRLKFETRRAAFFSMSFTKFYEHLSRHFDNALGYPNMLVLARAVLMIVSDTSICERVYSSVNRTQTKARASLNLDTICDAVTIKSLGPDVCDFNPRPILEAWMTAPFKNGNGKAKGRQIETMLLDVHRSMSSSHGCASALSASRDSSSSLTNPPSSSAELTTSPGGVGLINVGNSCFLNSTLQCLAAIVGLGDALLSDNILKSVNRSSCHGGRLIRAAADCLANVKKVSSTSAFAPRALYAELRVLHPEIFNWRQQDAQEAAFILLDGLHTELKRAPLHTDEGFDTEDVFRAREGSIINDLFLGFFKSTFRCGDCGNESITTEAFKLISLPIPCTKSCRIEECLDLFSMDEELTEDNMVFCPDCEIRVPGVKKLQLGSLPRCLVLHLKRFSQVGIRTDKSPSVPVSFPLEGLDIAPYSLNSVSTVYDCVAVCCHHGRNLHSGHYTAFSHRNGFWFFYDDEKRPAQVDAAKVMSHESCEAAYMIFYVRR